METGIVNEMKFRKTREMKMDVSLFATCNEPGKLSGALQSRFFIVEVEPYAYNEFYQITLCLLKNQTEFVPAIADEVWRTSQNVRDCIRIGKLARSEEDVKPHNSCFLFTTPCSPVEKRRNDFRRTRLRFQAS